jgi:heterodisulfide reductase subunit C2
MLYWQQLSTPHLEIVMRTLLSIDSVAGTFVKDVEFISGQDLLACNQCGKCGAGCPVAADLDLLPNDVLESQTIWICAACQTCVSRCPKDVDVPRVMEALRTLAMQRGIQPVDLGTVPDDLMAELPQMAVIGGYRKFSL